MDQLWQEAPAPAVRLWTEGGAVRWRLNRAALEWSLDVGVPEASWAAFAPTLATQALEGLRGRLRLGVHSLRWTAVQLETGTLVWLQPDRGAVPLSSDGIVSLAEKFELAQEFGRIGLFERDLTSGAGRWDKHMFRLFGLDPVLGTPPFDIAVRCVHPDDLEEFRARHLEYAARPGRYESRYRLKLADGRLRDIHSLVETRAPVDGKPTLMIGVLLDDTDSSNRVRAQMAHSEKLARALDLAGVSVWRIDLAKQRVEFNAAGLRLQGLPDDPAELPLAAALETVHPDDLPKVLQAGEDAERRHETVDVVARYRHADGKWLHLLTRRAAERDAAGHVVALTGVSLDQTAQVAERERAQALRRSVELVADAAGVGLWSVELETGLVEWNAQMRRIYGLRDDAPAPSLGHWVGSMIHAEDRRRVLARRREAERLGQRVFEVDFRVVRADGVERWVVCRSTHELRDGRPMVVGIHLDVTERRATEAELARQQDRLAMATRAAGMGVWERDAQGQAVFWDAQMYRLRGLDPSDPRPIEEITRTTSDGRLHAELIDKALRCMESGEPYEHEFRCVWADGSEHWIASVGTARRDSQGRAIGMIGVNFDITQRKRAEQALRERDAAERASRTKTEFLARMSHELRTPLNAVLGFAQLIEHDSARGLSPHQLERASRIRTAGQHLLSLIEDVLDLSAVEAGTLPMAMEPVAIDAAVEEVWQWVVPLAERYHVRLHRVGTGRWVSGDPRRLRQVLANLLTNAVKYNRPGGNVWIDAAPGAPGRVIVVVRDDGRGLDAEQREHLFEPFNRLGAENESVEGVGLGLVVVRRLVETMGGSISVDSAPGRGTAMKVDLAAAVPAAPTVAEPAAPLPSRATEDALTILYIEDNPVNVLLVEELVALRANMRLESAPDGVSGVAAALAMLPDVVLIDMQLPDIDGYEVLRRLRRAPEMAEARMIALSANAMPEDVARARAAGFDDYWTKPIDFTRFLDGLDTLARTRRAIA